MVIWRKPEWITLHNGQHCRLFSSTSSASQTCCAKITCIRLSSFLSHSGVPATVRSTVEDGYMRPNAFPQKVQLSETYLDKFSVRCAGGQ